MREDDDTHVRWAACRTFRVIGPGAHEAAPALVAAIKINEDGQLRELALLSLGQVACPEAKEIVPDLLKFYKDQKEDFLLRVNALAMLGKIGDKVDEVIPLITDALSDPTKLKFRAAAARSAEYLGARAKATVPSLIGALDIRKIDNAQLAEQTRLNVIRALQSIGPAAEGALPALRKMAEDTQVDHATRIYAAKAVKAIEGK